MTTLHAPVPFDADSLVRYEVRAEDDLGNPQIKYTDDLQRAIKLAFRARDNDASYISITDNQTGEIRYEFDLR